MLNNVVNFYLSCFVVANAICNINRFVLQESGKVVDGTDAGNRDLFVVKYNSSGTKQ